MGLAPNTQTHGPGEKPREATRKSRKQQQTAQIARAVIGAPRSSVCPPHVKFTRGALSSDESVTGGGRQRKATEATPYSVV